MADPAEPDDAVGAQNLDSRYLRIILASVQGNLSSHHGWFCCSFHCRGRAAPVESVLGILRLHAAASDSALRSGVALNHAEVLLLTTRLLWVMDIGSTEF